MREFEITLLFIFLNLIIYFIYPILSKFLNIYDLPNKRKIHKTKTPLIGGAIFLINIFLFYLLYVSEIAFTKISSDFFISNFNLLTFFFCVISIFILGALDDKFDINPNLKLFVLSIIIFLFLQFDNSSLIKELNFSIFENKIYLGKYSLLFSILCFLLFINACNMFDGINLQSSSYFLFFILALLILTNKNILFSVIIITLLNICLLNYKGKIFMGDSGIYLFSFVLGYLVIQSYNNGLIKNVDTIFILMMVPGIDMLRLFIIRIINKKNPFRPDMLHVHHLLIKKYNYNNSILTLNLMILIPIILKIINVNSLIIISSYLLFYIIFLRILKK